MNIPIAVAVGLTGLTTLVHVLAGGPDVHEPIQDSDLSDYLRALSAVLWHAVTVTLIVFTLALIWLVRRPNQALAWVISAVQVGFAGLFIFYGITRLGTLWLTPQWIIFLTIPALTVWGSWQQSTR